MGTPSDEPVRVVDLEDELHLSSSQIYLEIQKLGRLPGIVLHEPPGSPRRTRELALRLVELYPEALGPEQGDA